MITPLGSGLNPPFGNSALLHGFDSNVCDHYVFSAFLSMAVEDETMLRWEAPRERLCRGMPVRETRIPIRRVIFLGKFMLA